MKIKTYMKTIFTYLPRDIPVHVLIVLNILITYSLDAWVDTYQVNSFAYRCMYLELYIMQDR